MKKRNFQPVKHPGAATRKAEAEGVSLGKWEQEHKNDPGKTGKQARFPLIAKKWNHRGRKIKTKTAKKRVARKRT